MVELICDDCLKPASKLIKSKCRKCYDKTRVITQIAIPKKLTADFKEYMGGREDLTAGVIELFELGLRTWKLGKRVIVVPL